MGEILGEEVIPEHGKDNPAFWRERDLSLEGLPINREKNISQKVLA